MPANTSRSTTPVQSLSREEIEKPWKYIGYRGFSAFLASDDDFLIFRRFNTLNVRVFLFLQDRISVLETELNNIDLKHTDKNPVDIHNGSFREDSEPIRTELLLNIHHLLKEYNALLIQHSNLRSRAPVLKQDVQSLKNWFHNTQNAILDDEEAA